MTFSLSCHIIKERNEFLTVQLYCSSGVLVSFFVFMISYRYHFLSSGMTYNKFHMEHIITQNFSLVIENRKSKARIISITSKSAFLSCFFARFSRNLNHLRNSLCGIRFCLCKSTLQLCRVIGTCIFVRKIIAYIYDFFIYSNGRPAESLNTRI